jgi:hypothetical protein
MFTLKIGEHSRYLLAVFPGVEAPSFTQRVKISLLQGKFGQPFGECTSYEGKQK